MNAGRWYDYVLGWVVVNGVCKMTNAETNVASLRRAIGRVVEVSVDVGECRDNGMTCSRLWVAVEVVDVRKVWARIDLLVRPVSGAGCGWVSLERVRGAAIERGVEPAICSRQFDRVAGFDGGDGIG